MLSSSGSLGDGSIAPAFHPPSITKLARVRGAYSATQGLVKLLVSSYWPKQVTWLDRSGMKKRLLLIEGIAKFYGKHHGYILQAAT